MPTPMALRMSRRALLATAFLSLAGGDPGLHRCLVVHRKYALSTDGHEAA